MKQGQRMAARNVIKVIPVEEKWVVMRNDDVLSCHILKDEAIKQARMQADQFLSSQVLIYRVHGSIANKTGTI
jgi:hypothetical protein